MNSRKYTSSFNGIIQEIPGISVDNFENADIVKARAYFLSHCHSDHVQGLYSTTLLNTLKRTSAPIYMSRPSAAIVRHSHHDKSLMGYIKILELGTTLLTLPGDPEKKQEELILSVTLIPAGHCLGSVMYLFKRNIQTILFTGDFRIDCNDVSKYGSLHNKNGSVIDIDVLYIDTTFIDDKYEHFPKRSTSIECAVNEVQKWLNYGEDYYVALHTSARYGYEFLFNEIYKQLAVKVYVDDEKWKLYSTIQHLVPGLTNNEECTKIHVCRLRSNNSHSGCHRNTNTNAKYLYMHFSAMIWDDYAIDGHVIRKVAEDRVNVCFPTHCSSSELKHFITYLAPKKVTGFCNGEKTDLTLKYSGKNKRELTSNASEVSPVKTQVLCKSNRKRVKIDKKMDEKLLKEMFDL